MLTSMRLSDPWLDKLERCAKAKHSRYISAMNTYREATKTAQSLLSRHTFLHGEFEKLSKRERVLASQSSRKARIELSSIRYSMDTMRNSIEDLVLKISGEYMRHADKKQYLEAAYREWIEVEMRVATATVLMYQEAGYGEQSYHLRMAQERLSKAASMASTEVVKILDCTC